MKAKFAFSKAYAAYLRVLTFCYDVSYFFTAQFKNCYSHVTSDHFRVLAAESCRPHIVVI